MNKLRLKKMIFTSLFVVIIGVCSFITIPLPISGVPITLQIFAIFLATLILEGKWGCISIIVYLLLGGIGVPIFSGFKGGFGALFGITGGYLIGFIFIPIVYLIIMKIVKSDKLIYKIISLVIGLIICYIFGTIWFVILYSKNTGNITIIQALSFCVLPYIIPDLIKLGLAIGIYKLLEPIKNKYLT